MTKTAKQLESEIEAAMNAPPASGYTKFRPGPNRYPRASRREDHGEYEIFRRPSDYLVRYWPAIGAVGSIRASEKLGTYETIEEMLAAIDAHDAHDAHER